MNLSKFNFTFVLNPTLKFTDPSGYNYGDPYYNNFTGFGGMGSSNNADAPDAKWKDWLTYWDNQWLSRTFDWGGVEETANLLFDMGKSPKGLFRDGKGDIYASWWEDEARAVKDDEGYTTKIQLRTFNQALLFQHKREKRQRMSGGKTTNGEGELIQSGDKHKFNVWYGLGFGWDINIFGIGGKFEVNCPNVNIYSFENGKLSYHSGIRWFNIQVGHAAANVGLNNFNGKFNSKIHLGQMAISTDEGLRYSPLTIGFHYGIIGFTYESSRSYQNAGFEYYNARQQFFEATGFPMPWR